MGIFFTIVAIVFIVMFFLSWTQKGNNAKDGLWSGGFCAIILLVGAFMFLCTINELRSCSSHNSSYDYYDAPRK
jgi:uncharacterized membrane protein